MSMKKITVRLSAEQHAFLSQNGDPIARGVREAITKAMRLQKFKVKFERTNPYGIVYKLLVAKDMEDLLRQTGSIRNQLQAAEIVSGSRWSIGYVEEY